MEKEVELFRKTISIILLSFLVISALALAYKVQPVWASGTIYIRTDGSIDPPTAPMQQGGNSVGQSSVDWWPMFHHDLGHMGYSTSTAPNTNETIWSYATGSDVDSSPAVADGRVYVGSYDNKVYCLDGATGAFIWSYTTGYEVFSSPAVANGRVYVGSDDYKVYAFGPSQLIHDVAITNVTPSKNVVGQGFSTNINVTVANQGDYTETFDVTVYANTTVIETKQVTLTSKTSTTLTFTWNTAGFAKGNYTISAFAEPVQGETETTDNNSTDGWIIVAMIGDITGPNGWPDGKIDARDVAGICSCYGAKPPDPGYEPNWDITGPIEGLADGKIDARDVSLISSRYGQKDP